MSHNSVFFRPFFPLVSHSFNVGASMMTWPYTFSKLFPCFSLVFLAFLLFRLLGQQSRTARFLGVLGKPIKRNFMIWNASFRIWVIRGRVSLYDLRSLSENLEPKEMETFDLSEGHFPVILI